MRACLLALLLPLVACGAPPPQTLGTGAQPPAPDPGPWEGLDAGAGGGAGGAAVDGGVVSDGGVAVDDGSDAGVPAGPGATVTSGGVEFRVWAPDATGAQVAGDFPEQTVVMSAEPGGTFAALVAGAHAGSVYRFTLAGPTGPITRLDPYCRQVLADRSGCTVIDPSAYPWKSGAFTRPARNAAVVYEMHVGSFAVAPGAAMGTLADAQAGLAGLADLGVSVVELMPVQSSGGLDDNWGYDPQLYFSPRPAYGTADQLRAFIDAAHGLGIGVWMDTVVNHYDSDTAAPLVCFDGACPGTNGIYFFPPGAYATTPWGPRPDYTTPQVASMLEATVPWWLGEMRGDGFRWDSVSNIRGIDNGMGTTPGGQALLIAANDLTHAAGGTSVAEDLQGLAAITQPASAGGFGFDAQWDGFGYTVDGVLTTATDGARDLGAIQGALTGSYAGDPFARVLFTEDHDTVGNGGTRLPNAIDPADPTSFAARRLSMVGATMLLTTPGVPMLLMGQESLALGTFTDPPTPLADALPPQGAPVRAFYKDMIALRRNVAGGTGGLLDEYVDVLQRNDSAKVIAYRRSGASGEDVIVILNFADVAYQEYDIGVPGQGAWRIRLDTDWLSYGADFGGGQTGSVQTRTESKDNQPYLLPVQLAAYGAVVFSR